MLVAVGVAAAGCSGPDESHRGPADCAGAFVAGASCGCEPDEPVCAVDSSDRRWPLSCIDGRWQDRESDVCDDAPEVAFEKYVRGRACMAELTGPGVAGLVLVLLVGEDGLTIARAQRGESAGEEWSADADAYTITVSADEIWLNEAPASASGSEASDASSLRIGLRRIAVNAWEVGLAELPAALPWPSDLEWVRCERADPID
jgi:hypothetical protein